MNPHGRGAPAQRLGEIIRRQRELRRCRCASSPSSSASPIRTSRRSSAACASRPSGCSIRSRQPCAPRPTRCTNRPGMTVGEEPETSAVEQAVRRTRASPDVSARRCSRSTAFVAHARRRRGRSPHQLKRRRRRNGGSLVRCATCAPAGTRRRPRGRERRDRRHHDGPVVAQRLGAHEQPEVAARRRGLRVRSAGVETASASAKNCVGGVMWSVAPASRFTGS